jgi:two-component system, OmpR family, sensor histidine kinase BaeS
MMRSLSVKLVLAFSLVSLTAVALVAILVRQSTFRHFGQFEYDRNRSMLIDALGEHYRQNGTWDSLPFPLPPPLESTVAQPRERSALAIVGPDGRVVVEGRGYRLGDLVPPDEWDRAQAIVIDGQEVGRLLLDPDPFSRGLPEQAFLNRFNTTILLGAAGALLAALGLGLLLARRISGPLKDLTAATRRVAAGDLNLEVPIRSQDDLGELARAFNQMGQALARARDLRRQMTADIAHELRTPTSVILGHAEGVMDGVLELSLEEVAIIRDEAARLERLIEDLRLLSRSDAGELALDIRRFSATELLERAAQSARLAADRRQIELRTVKPQSPLEVDSDPDRIAQVLDNLISNALQHAPPGSVVELGASPADDRVRFFVRDHGPGIDAQDLPHIFDRFYRADRARQRDSGGSGLGLAIARSFVESLGGRMQVESRLGEGSSFSFSLPIHR